MCTLNPKPKELGFLFVIAHPQEWGCTYLGPSFMEPLNVSNIRYRCKEQKVFNDFN